MRTRTILIAALLGLAACNPRNDSSEKPEMILQAYTAPEGTARDLRNALNVALKGKKDGESAEGAGNVAVAPDGRLIVLAPAKVQQGIQALIADLGTHQRATPATVELSYWFVVGTPGAGEIGAGLQEVKGTLDEVAKVQGPMTFKLLDKLRLAAMSGERADVSGRFARVFQQATISPQRSIVADLRIDPTGPQGSLTTVLQIEPGQTLVLGQAGFNPDPRDSAKQPAEDGATLFYLVRASIRNAATAQP